jgi:Lrp/AsnC family leucine-responsive transcriptional regulator
MDEKILAREKNTVDKLPKIDIRDRKLLYYLSQDSRISYTQLAKKVSLSKNAVKYRITRLKNLGVITQFTSTINLGALRYYTFTVLFRFNEDIYKNKEIINYFKNHEFADWVSTLSGHWDIFAEFACVDLFHMSKIIDKITRDFGEKLNTYQIFLSNDTLRVEHLVGDFYKDLKLMPMPNNPRRIEEYKADKTDKRILNLLGEDSSLDYLQIAEKLGLTLDIVRYRVKNLIKGNILIKSFPEISLKKIGLSDYIYILKLRNVSEEKFENLKKSIKASDNILYAFIDKNSYYVIFHCAFKNLDGMDSFSRMLREEFSEIIESQDYLIIKEQVFFNLFPRGLINL